MPASYQNLKKSRNLGRFCNSPPTGRLFRDDGEKEPVAVVSESAARIIWPGQDPIGKRLNKFIEAKDDYSRVIGVVGDVLSGGLDKAPHPRC